MESWAEKYRPNSLSEIIGNTKTISQLQNWAGSWGEKMTKKASYCQDRLDVVKLQPQLP